MEEGLFQLVFIFLVFIAAIFDAVGRGRKKRQRMEEMEREEAEGSVSAEEELEWESSERAPSDPEPSSPREASPRAERGGSPEGGERKTADRMIPEDLWAVLTGEEPPSTRTEPPSTGPETSGPSGRGAPPAAPGRGEPSPPSRPSEPPRPSPAWDERREDVEEALGRRSDPDPPEHPHIPQPVPGDRYRARVEEDPRSTEPRSKSRRPISRAEGRPATRRAGAAEGAIGDPWRATPDIVEGEIDGESPTKERAQTFPGPRARRRGRSASRYARLLESGDRESLREAVVLRELLDVPLARRGSYGGWDEER